MAPPITCACGECEKCKRRVYMRDYYKEHADRVRQVAKESRNRRIESVRAYDRERGFRVYGNEKITARNRARVLPEQPCEICGDKGEKHHDDYSKPLSVRYLCRQHHAEHHRRY